MTALNPRMTRQYHLKVGRYSLIREGSSLLEFESNWYADIQYLVNSNVFFRDFGSTIQFLGQEADNFEQNIKEFLESIRDICSYDWYWNVQDVVILEEGLVIDNRKYVWISFDSKEDAVLCRMTHTDLRNQKYAYNRGLS